MLGLAGALLTSANAMIDTQSTFFATAAVEDHATVATASDGDLWPSCWADDDQLYSANGDGSGFSPSGPSVDIAVSRISGYPGALSGNTLARSEAVGPLWGDPARHNRKPTGMICVDGVLYLAVQDLALDFDDAPAATICRSDDKGRTWTWDKSGPMFKDYIFTTIFFIDFGKNNAHAPDNYVYAYGIDHNWRDSFKNRVPDPTKLFLARVPKGHIQQRNAWQFYAGVGDDGTPAWTADITAKMPVLHDEQRVYQKLVGGVPARNMSVISQGGVVYSKPLNRYLYTSWTEYTFEFYEAPQPWGPWKKFLSKDFGAYPWLPSKSGGYGVTIPSKFISADGKTMYLQSNTFVSGVRNYHYSLRKLVVEPFVSSRPRNKPNAALNLARVGEGTTVLARTLHFGQPHLLNNGQREESEDSWNSEAKTSDGWGYAWKRAYRLNKVVYTSGTMFPAGGWFRGDLKVQVRQNHQWVDVSNLSVSPLYSFDQSAGPYKTYTFNFDDTWGDGVRLVGTPGGDACFTSIAELEVYFAPR